YAFVLGLSKPATAGATIVALFRAEPSRRGGIIGVLWLVLTRYKTVPLPASSAPFFIPVLLFRVALLFLDCFDEAKKDMAVHFESTTDYIQHHLTFFQKPGEGAGFWNVNVDTIVTTLVIGVLTFGFLWLVVRKATTGVPSKRQAFVELLFDF